MLPADNPDLLCFSHSRWDFIVNRPRHLMVRWARDRRVWFFQEPDPRPSETAYLDVRRSDAGVYVVTPHLPKGAHANSAVRMLLGAFMAQQEIRRYATWYYTPLALAFTEHLKPLAIVYDCMEELSAQRNAPIETKEWERMLLARADLVFAGGQGLLEAKRPLHPSVHAFASAVDASHFGHARVRQEDPMDQASIPHPRLGWFGVIDDRVDLDLISAIAWRRPDWHIVLIGPVVGVSPAALPQGPNIHYLGTKPYSQLPNYLAGWDVAIQPYAHNEATRLLCPAKTLEYLAGGKPVASTSLRDVVQPFGSLGLIEIGDSSQEFEQAIERALASDADIRRQSADAFLDKISWESTWRSMKALVNEIVAERAVPLVARGIEIRPPMRGAGAARPLPANPARPSVSPLP